MSSDVFANHYRERTVACFMARCEDVELAMYGPVEEEAFVCARVAPLLDIPDEERREVLHEQMAGIQTAEASVMLSDIHPNWLVDILAHESPRVVGLLLRYLPSRHSRFVMEQLPASLRRRLPHVVDAFAVSDVVMRIVRQRFESHFLPVRPASQVEVLDFANISALRLQDLEVLIHDLGIEELALALAHMSTPALRLILNRLPFAEAQSLSERIRGLAAIDPHLEREARYGILETSFERGAPASMMQEIGIQFLAKAMQSQHISMVPMLKQKLPPKLAYLLQRDADIHVLGNHGGMATKRQHRILCRVAQLARGGQIDSTWFSRLPEEIQTDTIESSRVSSEMVLLS